MVKDEEEFLEDALRSAQDFCDEMVVVDTGSTDRTVEIAHDMGARVSHFPWCNDFSAARNETLKHARGQWIAILDADERFQGDGQALKARLEPGPQHPFEAVMLNVTNTRLDGSPISSFYSVRVFPNDPRLGYSGRVHNRFGALGDDAPKVACTQYAGLGIIHLGYDPELYIARQKAARSLPLIEATVREEPHNHLQRFYLGREYLLLGRMEDAIPTLVLAYKGILASGHGPLADAATHLAQALLHVNAPNVEILKVTEGALMKHPRHPDLWWDKGRIQIRLGQYIEAADALEKSLAYLAEKGDGQQIRLRHRQWEVSEVLGSLYWDLKSYPKAYAHYQRAFNGKPADTSGWENLLHHLCALAIELGHNDALPDYLERLLRTDKAPLGMFFFHLDQVYQHDGKQAASDMLSDALKRCPRMVSDPEFIARRHLLEPNHV